MTIRAVYERGVFRPTEPVELPEGTIVQVQAPEGVVDGKPAMTPGLAEIYAVLGERFDTGARDLAERHNEHQP